MTLISILPKQILQVTSQSPQFSQLPHPRTSLPSLYYLHNPDISSNDQDSILFEVQTVDPHSQRSWFLSTNSVIADGKLMFLTPMDPLFLLIPLLLRTVPEDNRLGAFRPFEDILEDAATNLSSQSPTLNVTDILHLARYDCIRKALPKICDFKEITEDLVVYRFSRSNLIDTLKKKVVHLSQPSILIQFPCLRRQLARNGLLLEEEEKKELRQSAGIRIACELVGQYVPEDIMSEVLNSYDFSLLDAHIQTLMDQTNAMPASSAQKTRTSDTQNEQKRKATSQLSKGAAKLMRVNIKGMAKISSFFKKTEK